MIFTRGIARTAGRALAVRRANAALFGTSSVAPRAAPIFNAGNASSRKSQMSSSFVQGIQSLSLNPPSIGFS
jgi:hypothetical protein